MQREMYVLTTMSSFLIVLYLIRFLKAILGTILGKKQRLVDPFMPQPREETDHSGETSQGNYNHRLLLLKIVIPLNADSS